MALHDQTVFVDDAPSRTWMAGGIHANVPIFMPHSTSPIESILAHKPATQMIEVWKTFSLIPRNSPSGKPPLLRPRQKVAERSALAAVEHRVFIAAHEPPRLSVRAAPNTELFQQPKHMIWCAPKHVPDPLNPYLLLHIQFLQYDANVSPELLPNEVLSVCSHAAPRFRNLAVIDGRSGPARTASSGATLDRPRPRVLYHAAN